MLPGVKPRAAAPEFNSYGCSGMVLPTGIDGGTCVALPSSPLEDPACPRYAARTATGKEAKASPLPRTRLLEGQVQARDGRYEGAQAMDFESYAAFFAVSPAGPAEVARREGEDAERNVAKQEEAEALRLVKEGKQLVKAIATQELMAATAEKLKAQRRPQQCERGDYQELRFGQECGPPWPTKKK